MLGKSLHAVSSHKFDLHFSYIAIFIRFLPSLIWEGVKKCLFNGQAHLRILLH